MRRWWLWVVLGVLFGGIVALVWQLLRQQQRDYEVATTSFMSPVPDDEFVPRDDPAIYFPDATETSTLTTAEFAPPALEQLAPDAPIINAPEAVPEPEDVNNALITPEPPPNLGAPDAQPLALETSSPARTAAQATTNDEHQEDHEGELDGITGYCVRCKEKRAIQEPQAEITESGRRAARGTCPVCGTTIFRFLKDAATE